MGKASILERVHEACCTSLGATLTSTSNISAGLNFSMLADANNGMVEAWIIMATEAVLGVGFSMWYEAVRARLSSIG